MLNIFRSGYTLNKIKQFSFVVEYVYLAFICILIIRNYKTSAMDFGMYMPLLINISIVLLYSIVIYHSGREKEPTKKELFMRIVYLFFAGKLLVETQNPSVQIILVLPTVIMALRYRLKYTILTVLVTTLVVLISEKLYHQYEFDYLIIFISFVWVIGLLVNASVEVERKMLEEREKLQEKEKLAAIGKMAAGIVHEVRNPLATIKGFVQLLDKYNTVKDADILKRYLEMIDKEVDRMNNLLKDFLQFARPAKPKLAFCNINETILDINVLLEAQCMNKCIDMELLLAPDMPVILCDNNQMKQVIVNIALNAIDAMMHNQNRKMIVRTAFDQNNVHVQIEDSGIGMSEEQVRSIFNPFYTTKENGTGLGLSVCYSIIENHRGRIEVKSLPNQGTVFIITIPRHN